MFEPPPMEWITERLGRLQDLLERQTERSALLLRRVLGPVRLVPTRPDVGRPFYRAETALQALELLEPPEGGSNWSRQWRRGESNRPVEDGEGRRSKLDGYLRRRGLPPATVVYPQSVPEGQPGNVSRAHSGGVIASRVYLRGARLCQRSGTRIAL